MGLFIQALLVLFLSSPLIRGQYDDDGLQDALDVIAQRERAMENVEDEYGQYQNLEANPQDDLAFLAVAREFGGNGQPENIGYGYQKYVVADNAGKSHHFPQPSSSDLVYSESVHGSHNPLENVMDYIDADDVVQPMKSVFRERGKKSVFRERSQQEQDNRQRKLHYRPVSTKQQDHDYRDQRLKNVEEEADEEYLGYLENIWEKYKNENPTIEEISDLSDRDIEGILNHIKDSGPQKSLLENIGTDVAKRNFAENDYDFFNNQNALGGWNNYQIKKRRIHKVDADKDHSQNYQYSVEALQPVASTEIVESPSEGGYLIPSGEDDEMALVVANVIEPLKINKDNIYQRQRVNSGSTKNHGKGTNSYKNYYGLQKYAPAFHDRRELVVAKRSSNAYISTGVNKNKKVLGGSQHSAKRRQNVTDPKVEKELSQIFSLDNSSPSEVSKESGSSKVHPLSAGNLVSSQPNDKVIIQKNRKSFVGNNYEESDDENEVPSESDFPIYIQKKSVDWSDYFGIDRRKKDAFISEPEINNDWIYDQYYRAMKAAKVPPKSGSNFAMQGGFMRKRSPNIQVASPNSKEVVLVKRMKKRRYGGMNEQDIAQVDDKILRTEDEILNGAVKYTGSHEGANSIDEIEEVKNKVINDLINLNNLEELRQALRENKYKPTVYMRNGQYAYAEKPKRLNVFKEVAENNPFNQGLRKQEPDGEEYFTEEYEDQTSQSEPMSEGLMGQLEDGEQDDDDCTPLELIVRRCRGVVFLIGAKMEAFLPLCSLHQVCYACGPVTSPSPAGCDIMFLAEADELCKGNATCKEVARHTVTSLKHLAEKYPAQCMSVTCAMQYFLNPSKK